MKSYHLKRKRGEAEREEGEKEGAKKNLQHSPLHHVRSEGESWEDALVGGGGRKSVPTVLPPCIFLIPSAHTQPLSFILLLKCAFIIQWNFIQQLRRGSLLNVSEQNCDGGI